MGCGEVWDPVGYGVSEYTLVFQRDTGRITDTKNDAWLVVRPSLERRPQTRQALAGGVAEVFAVPICSVLALDATAYERFLGANSVLDDILALLGRASVCAADDAETVRKEIQALVMAAEVRHIVERMSA